MKNLLLTGTMFFAFANTGYGAAPTVDVAKGYVNHEAVAMVEILNSSFTKLNILTCSQLTAGRIDDLVIHATASQVGVDRPAFNMRIVHEAPVKTGMEKRVLIYTQDPAVDGGPVVTTGYAAVVEFTCDMKKGYWVQTGPMAGAEESLLEATWDNSTGTSQVQFRLIGSGSDVMYVTSGGSFVTQVMDYSNLLTYMQNFGLNYRGPSNEIN